MRVWLFIFLYGAVAMSGAFLSFFWAHFAYCRAKLISHPSYKDRTFVLSAAIAMVAIGLALVDGARAIGNIEFGLSAILQRNEAYFIGVGLVFILFGLFKMTWLADLERHPPKWMWTRAMLGMTLLWSVIAALLAPGVPFNG